MIAKLLPVLRRSEEASNTDFFQHTLKKFGFLMSWPNRIGRLVRCHGQFKAVKCTEILQENLHQPVKHIFEGDKRPFIFQNDNAPPHRAKKTKIDTKLRETSDRNIIEHVCSLKTN